MLKKIILGIAIGYTTILHLLLIIHFSDNPVARAVLLMGFTLFIIWVVFGSWLQRRMKNKYLNYLSRSSASPVIFFTLWAVGLACLEEVVTTSITNSAPLFGVRVGEAYITASANYFDVIAMHSVIVFIPMLFTLGLIARRYALSPLQITSLWGFVGIFAELTFAGTQALINAPLWFMVYGLMVYLPSHVFLATKRRNYSYWQFPLFFILILVSAITVFWIPVILDHPSIHFPPLAL